MKKTTKKKIVEEKQKFLVTLTLGTDVYTGEGDTAINALQALPKPEKIMAKAVFCISDGVKKREVLMYPVRLKRLFYNKLFQEIQLKSLCMGMK